MASNIITFNWHYLDKAAELYRFAYAVPTTGEFSPQEISREVIIGHVMRDSFIGVLAVDDEQNVIGLAWGYASPNDNERLRNLVVKKLGQEWVENTFVVEAFAVHSDHYKSDLAQRLHEGLKQRVQENNYDRMRIRLESARKDNIPETLLQEGWRKLQSLAHVSWMGVTCESV